MAWRLAKSLETLRGQINALAPKRSKVSDGTVGDLRHSKTASDHNPRLLDGEPNVVSAIDFTHDPANGCDANLIAEAVKLDPRTKYVIWNKRIYNASVNKVWRAYHGVNGHTRHVHISVLPKKALFDSTAPWDLTIPAPIPVPPPPAPVNRATLKRGMTGGDVPVLQLRLRELGYYKGLVDGNFGPQTESALKAFQKATGLKVDGIAGPITWAKLASAASPAPPAPNPPPTVPASFTSERGREHIKSFETLALTAYELGGIWHIGYGRSNSAGKLPHISKGLTITKAEADAMFLEDLADFEDYVKFYVKVPLTQGQFDALVSIVFNKGPTWFKDSQLLKAVNDKAWGKVADLILKEVPPVGHRFHRGLLRRRKDEVALLNS